MGEESWHEARLIPTSGINGAEEQERRATSAVLAVLTAVKEYNRAILGPFGAPAGAVEAFIEVPFALGERHVWGGGNFDGPTGGGFDCSGLVLYAAYQASSGRIRLPHYTGDQIHLGQPVSWADKQPGDLIFFSYPGAGGPHHVAIYVGGDKILQAPRTGEDVRYGTSASSRPSRDGHDASADPGATRRTPPARP